MKRPLARLATALAAGLVFGSGLMLSGMTQPAKVQGFLDLAGLWDPSLALVMVAAILVATPAFRLVAGRERSLLDGAMQLPPRQPVNARLLVGSALFGLGWGISGYCPGPALVSLVGGSRDVLLFVVAMAGGMVAFDHLWPRVSAAGGGSAGPPDAPAGASAIAPELTTVRSGVQRSP